ncbi:exocyst complex component 6-like [Oncorhynchus nerka]|uniref:exocyst complex component 6-like n=1 Tax=Oncorhynchus nerka TaxID=8023 RepID=UPI0031B81650
MRPVCLHEATGVYLHEASLPPHEAKACLHEKAGSNTFLFPFDCDGLPPRLPPLPFQSYCSDPDLVLQLKNLIVIFADTLQGYGYPVNRLFDLLFEIRDQYNETLLKKWALVFREIFELDNYSPIPVETEEEYKSVVSRFPFHDAEIEKQDFPKKLPMSQSVPQIYVQVKEFIYASLKFSESLHRR